MVNVDIGIFAHNESANIRHIIREIAKQDIFTHSDMSAVAHVLANGCSDDTVEKARLEVEALGQSARILVHDLPQGGKSRTWNAFVHRLSRPEAEQLLFCDADISLPQLSALRDLSTTLSTRPDVDALSSRPVKDLSVTDRPLTFVETLILKSAGSLDDWRTAICGQLYIQRSATARSLYLPIGLPVEDGFVREMLATKLYSAPENLSLLDGVEGVHHIYPSETTISGLIHHQTRIIIGSAVNRAIFKQLKGIPPQSVPGVLKEASGDEKWVSDQIRHHLPTWTSGWVPFHFLTKRLVRFAGRKMSDIRFKDIPVLGLGFAFDAVVYVLAQLKMSRGVGAGHW